MRSSRAYECPVEANQYSTFYILRMQRMFLTLIAVVSLSAVARAQGFVGTSVAAIQAKARPDSVHLAEMGRYGVTYYVESPDETHHSVYNVTSFAKTGVCTSYEYVAPLAEKAALTAWLDRFYLKKDKNTWRSHNGILLTLAVEGSEMRLTESKPAADVKK